MFLKPMYIGFSVFIGFAKKTIRYISFYKKTDNNRSDLSFS